MNRALCSSLIGLMALGNLLASSPALAQAVEGTVTETSRFRATLGAAGGYAYLNNVPIHMPTLDTNHHVNLHGPQVEASLTLMWALGQGSTALGLRLSGYVLPMVWDKDSPQFFSGIAGGARAAAELSGKYLWGSGGLGLYHLNLKSTRALSINSLGAIDDRTRPELYLAGGVRIPIAASVKFQLGTEFDWDLFTSTFRVAGSAGLNLTF